MIALLEACQTERPNAEQSDLTVLVIRSLGLMVGKMVKNDGYGRDVSDTKAVSDVYSRRTFVLVQLITSAAVMRIDRFDPDDHPDTTISRRIGRTLTRMRISHSR
jgi:hypothetical protein